VQKTFGNDHPPLEETRGKWREVLGRRHIDNVVVALDSPLAEALLLEPSWREVDVGDDVVAFRKRDQLCFAHGDKHEIVNANVTWPERARYYHPLEIGRD
jgi:hypothetical protein